MLEILKHLKMKKVVNFLREVKKSRDISWDFIEEGLSTIEKGRKKIGQGQL